MSGSTAQDENIHRLLAHWHAKRMAQWEAYGVEYIKVEGDGSMRLLDPKAVHVALKKS